MKTRWMIMALVSAVCSVAFAGITDGDIKVQGDTADLKGIQSLAVQCKVRGANLYLKGEGDSPSTDMVVSSVTDELKAIGITVDTNAPTVLLVECDTPGGTFMTYVNFIVQERAVLLRDRTSERKITIWMATGYQRGQVHPEPVGRLTRTFGRHWAEANGKTISLPPEKRTEELVVKLMPQSQCEVNGKTYSHDELIAALKKMEGADKKLIKVSSGWPTRSDMGAVFKMLKDAGFNAKIDFRMGEGGEEEKSFIKEWKGVSGDKKK